ncbi:hypothetical protein [Halomonas sp. hl-4]|uniref:hypothetical protein n=1 Tax=Halomonas sp. hl-4 TaxID=1761789 RepID=UPI000BBFFE8D|nr:hypothetical protein [Halomonas sp. hl-4]SNY95530.1 hypothetical protein SAMN04488142_0030 [Halomonas sp. hl-4]
MMHRYLLREYHEGRIVPRNDRGLFHGLRLAKQEAKRLGYPPQLIKKVTRHEQENA